MADDSSDPQQMINLTADIVSAYVSKNNIGPDRLAGLIADVHEALGSVGQPIAEPAAPKPDKAAIRKSMSPDFLTSFIDGRKYKSLKRHLNQNGLDGDGYRARFGLPKDYPMVAAGYSAERSRIAKSLGLGRKSAETAAPPPNAKPSKAKAKVKPTAGLKAAMDKIKPDGESFT